MSLTDDPTETQTSNSETQTSKDATPPQPMEPKKTGKYPPKQAKAIEIAKKYTNLPYSAARNRIMEETPCSKSVAHKAIHLLKEQTLKSKGKPSESAEFKITEEKDVNAPFIEAQALEPTKEPTVEPTTELEPSDNQAKIIISDEDKQQLDLFQDMLRGSYTMLFSKDGLLGEKYGRTQKQCENLADMQFRWLVRRYDVQALQKFDTVLLVGAYANVFGGIAKEYMADRAKKTAEKRAP